jgi:hypothetical protein
MDEMTILAWIGAVASVVASVTGIISMRLQFADGRGRAIRVVDPRAITGPDGVTTLLFTVRNSTGEIHRASGARMPSHGGNAKFSEPAEGMHRVGPLKDMEFSASSLDLAWDLGSDTTTARKLGVRLPPGTTNCQLQPLFDNLETGVTNYRSVEFPVKSAG